MGRFWQRIKQDWRDLMGLIRGEVDEPVKPPRVRFEAIDQNVDWFVWESEQIQKGGYVFWFDHWRYEGQQAPHEEPTLRQWRQIIQSSYDSAVRQFGQRRVDEAVAYFQEIQGRCPNDRTVGQDPTRWLIEQAEARLNHKTPDTLHNQGEGI